MRVRTEPWIFGLTAASAAAVLLSIAAAQILLVAAAILWLYGRPVRVRWPSYFLPLGAVLLTTVLSMAASPDPGLGVWSVRKFWLCIMGLLAANFVTSTWRALKAHQLLIGVAALAASIGVVQFVFTTARFLRTHDLADDPTVLARITGTMGHWMTFGGEQLLVWCVAVPALLVLGRRWTWPVAVIEFAIVLSFTRSVWIGAAVGFAAVSFSLPRRLILGVLLPVAIMGVAGAPFIYHRVMMSFQKEFSPDTSRLAMLDVGFRMIRDHPLFGVGPERIDDEFPKYYRGTDLGNFYYGHLHNNMLQLAAERGLLCLAAFLWFLLELYRSLLRLLKASDEATRWLALSALSALTAFVTAGFLEYNFGDSEVLLLLLFIVSIPFGVLASNVQEDPHRQQG